jgi:multicomponent Na+:H+ antiporter subunit D
VSASIDTLAPYPVVVPLVGAAVLVALHVVARRRFADALATGVAAAVTVICLVLLVDSLDGTIVYWFGDWTPRGSVVLGVGFVIDPIGSGMAAVCAGLVTVTFVYTWRYFDAVGVLFHSLVLVFLAAICGFCLSGDLFNMFVYFELMSVAAYGLTGYKAEEPGPLQGTLNFAVTNSIGALMILSGIALLYARTGALNLAAIGRGIAAGPTDGLVVVAFVFVIFGFLVKGAVVPFHFWLADAHAVAPTPVCVLFSGVMVELGLYAAARSYWTVFAPGFEVHETELRGLLVAVGVVTALVGAVMSLVQEHLKRLLAFSTVTYAGLFLLGFAMLDARGLAGTALFVMAHAFLKGALFMSAGVLLHRWGTVDLGALTGLGRGEWLTGVLFVVAGIGLIGLPPFGTFIGKALIEESAADVGFGWLVVVFVVASGLSAAAGLRATARVFLGWDPPVSVPPTAVAAHFETAPERTRTPLVMLVPIAVLVAVGLGLALVPHLVDGVERATLRFVDAPAYASRVIDGAAGSPHREAESTFHVTGTAVAASIATTIVALAAAALALARRRLPRAVMGAARRGSTVLAPLRSLHSGHVGDYIAWLTVGVALFGGILAVATR